MSLSTPLRFLHAASYHAPQGQNFPPHRHTCWELVFYRKGYIEAPIGDQVFQTHPGLLLCTPPGMVHSERALTSYANDFIALEAPATAPWPRAVVDDDIGTLSYLCRALMAESRLPTLAGLTPKLKLLLGQLDLFLCSHHELHSLSSAETMVCAAERIIDTRFATSLEIGSIAAELGIASSALRAYFARFRGYSPSEALLRVRLQRALILLRSSDLSLEQIAAASGFYSPSHLSRHIKMATGLSPGKWRQHKTV